ncbi:translation initiation factor IF-3 [Trichloromonas sp.]|uniref:translation initiation factor IF-3 n=1 Tax=Trichloromonas sp. TaxID=3069249 RepID=UPI002A43C421|nr:translation initiation factor IF-3 [Trichloromonas sp.]
MGKEKNSNIRINNQIRVSSVRLVGDNVEQGVYSINEAIKIANDLNLDLIEINPKSDPPVCKIEDFNKFLYIKKKKQKEIEKNNKANRVELKEMRFTPNTDDHDYNFKKNHIINFIKNGDRVRTYVFFKGREITHKDRGQILLLKLADELSDIAIVEKMPVLEGNKMTMFLKPKK